MVGFPVAMFLAWAFDITSEGIRRTTIETRRGKASVALALVANLIVAAVSGVTIPLFLKKIGVDPALAGSVVLTTVTDVVGFWAFLGLGALFLT